MENEIYNKNEKCPCTNCSIKEANPFCMWCEPYKEFIKNEKYNEKNKKDCF